MFSFLILMFGIVCVIGVFFYFLSFLWDIITYFLD